MPYLKIAKHIRIKIRIVLDNFSNTQGTSNLYLRNKYNLYIADNRETKEIMGEGRIPGIRRS